MNNKIKEIEEVVKKYTIFCPVCNREIKGNSPSQVEYALQTHLNQKHKEEKWKTKINKTVN